jgi:polar amino acid transport system substrate-binding protein
MTIRLVALVAALVLGFAGETYAGDDTLTRIAERGALVAAAVPDQLPLAARSKDGTLTGFDIEVAEEIGRRLGVPVRFVTPGWEAILAGNWQDRWDMSVSSITPTDKRAKSLAFPVVYRFDAAVVAVRRDDERYERSDDVSGQIIGVKADTTFEQYLKRTLTLPGVDTIDFRIDDPAISAYPDKEDAIKALTEGAVDAVVTSLATAQAAISGGAAARVLPGILFLEPVAVAVEPGDEAFARKIEEVVLSMSGDGTLRDLSITWFGIDFSQDAIP